MSTPTTTPSGPRWSMRCRTSVRSGACGTTSWLASVVPPGDRWRQVHDCAGLDLGDLPHEPRAAGAA